MASQRLAGFPISEEGKVILKVIKILIQMIRFGRFYPFQSHIRGNSTLMRVPNLGAVSGKKDLSLTVALCNSVLNLNLLWESS